MIRIAIADDHAIVRQGLRQILAAHGDFEVIGEAANHGEVMQLLRKETFDVLLGTMELESALVSLKPTAPASWASASRFELRSRSCPLTCRHI